MFNPITEGLLKAMRYLSMYPSNRASKHPAYQIEHVGKRLTLNVCKSVLNEGERELYAQGRLDLLPKKYVQQGDHFYARRIDHGRYNSRNPGGQSKERGLLLRKPPLAAE